MKSSIYEYRDYKTFIVDCIEGSSGGRGKRKELAHSIGCQVSHVTNVLSGAGHFSPEQAEGTARFFGLNTHETEFFLLLVQYNRSGTKSLSNFLERLLKERQEKYSALKQRLKMPDSLRSREEAHYYSSWQFGAVHVLLSIPEFQNRQVIAAKLGIAQSRVDEILEFLLECGLCKKEGQRYLPNRPLLHLDKASPLISKHHANWRLRTLTSLESTNEKALHYSSVFSVSKKDYPRVREILSQALTSCMKVISESPEEEIATLGIDLFPL